MAPFPTIPVPASFPSGARFSVREFDIFAAWLPGTGRGVLSLDGRSLVLAPDSSVPTSDLPTPIDESAFLAEASKRAAAARSADS